MIKMNYQAQRLDPPLVLASGTYKEYNYYVLSMGTHPCGYIEIPKSSKYYNVDYDNIPIECHGGLTYSSNYLGSIANECEERYFIGWDYAHYMDYVGYYSIGEFKPSFSERLKKFTTIEIIHDCLKVIEQLISLERED